MSCNDLSIGARHVEVLPRAGIVAVGIARPAKLKRCLRHSIAPRTVGHVHRVLHRASGKPRATATLPRTWASGVRPPKVPEARAAVQGAQDEARAARSPCPRISLTRASAVAKPVAVVSPARPLALALVIAFVSLAHAAPIERASIRVRVSPNLYARQSKPCDPAPGIDEKPGKVSFSVRMRYAPDEREYLVAVSRCCGGPNGD